MNCLRFRSRQLIALAAWLGAVCATHAHSVWIEDTTDKQLVVRFGEVGETYEKSPGHLDSLTLPLAWTADQDGKLAPLVVQTKADHFLFVAGLPGKPALGETRFPVMQHGKNPASWPQFYVRWQPVGAPVPAEPALTLDLVPTEKAGEIRIFFRGKPLPGAVVKVHGQGKPEGKEDKITADAEGRIQFTPGAAGLVMLTCNHREKVNGYAGGKAYDLTSHNSSLTWRQP